MTPKEARTIYYQGRQDAYTRVTLRSYGEDGGQISLAGLQAVIDALTQELDIKWAEQYLALSQGSEMLGEALRNGMLNKDMTIEELNVRAECEG